MNAPGVDVAKWDLRAEEKKIGGAYDSAVAKFDMPAVSRETPKTTASVAGKGTPIGEPVERKPAQKRKSANAQAMHIVLARTVLEVLENDGYRLMFTERGAYVYEEGLWTLRDDAYFKGWLNAALEEGAQEGLKVESTVRLINEARAYIVRQPRLQGRGTVFDAHGKVPTLSGLIDPKTGQLEPCRPEHFCTWQIPYHYDPEATCPHWLQIMEDALADRPDHVRAEYVQLLQEWAGMGLIDKKAKGLSKALSFAGGSNTGKSTLITVLANLYSTSHISTPLDALDGTHGTMPFAYRRPYVLHEAFDPGKWHLPSKAKALIEGQKIEINMKSGRIFEYAFTAPVIWGANADPQFKEATKAIYNRLLVVGLKREFGEDDPPVGAAIAARVRGLETPSDLVIEDEMPGVLAWSFKGLQRAQARNHFLIPTEVRAALDAIYRDNNIAQGFVEDCVDFDPDCMIGTADFTAAFTSWWAVEKGGRNTPSPESIGRQLKSLGNPRIAIDRTDLRQAATRYYAGICFNETGMKHWLDALNRDAFNFEGFKGGMSTESEGPVRNIPAEWSGKAVVKAMRAAHVKTMTVRDDRFPGDVPLPKNGHRKSDDRSERSSERSSNGHRPQPIDPDDDIPF
jgi:hypothetical protein